MYEFTAYKKRNAAKPELTTPPFIRMSNALPFRRTLGLPKVQGLKEATSDACAFREVTFTNSKDTDFGNKVCFLVGAGASQQVEHLVSNIVVAIRVKENWKLSAFIENVFHPFTFCDLGNS